MTPGGPRSWLYKPSEVDPGVKYELGQRRIWNDLDGVGGRKHNFSNSRNYECRAFCPYPRSAPTT